MPEYVFYDVQQSNLCYCAHFTKLIHTVRNRCIILFVKWKVSVPDSDWLEAVVKDSTNL